MLRTSFKKRTLDSFHFRKKNLEASHFNICYLIIAQMKAKTQGFLKMYTLPMLWRHFIRENRLQSKVCYVSHWLVENEMGKIQIQ